MDQAQRGRLLGILVTFRRPDKLTLVLQALAAQDRSLDSLIVVDNDPTTESKEIVHRNNRYGDSLQYIPAPKNLGPAGAIALGMDRIMKIADDRDWIVLVDDDDPPLSTTLLRDLEHFGESMAESDPRTAAVGRVGARFDFRRARLIAMSRIAAGKNGSAVPVDVIGGGHFPFYRVSAVRTVGTFSATLFFGLDDIEYGLRLRKAGFALYANASLWREARKVDGRIGLDVRPSVRLSDASWRRYYELRNLIYILRSFGHTWTAVRVSLVRGIGKPLANLAVTPRASLQHLRMNLRACWDGWTGRLGRTLEPESDKYGA